MTTLTIPPAMPTYALANGAAAVFDILNSDPEAAFDALAQHAAEAISAPMAGISFFDATEPGRQREWFKACKNLPAATLTKDQSFCWPLFDTASPSFPTAEALPSHVVITDMRTDERHIEHPWVVGPPHVCFYAATSIVLQGHIIGALSVFDNTARDITADELNQLAALAALAAARLEARLEVRQKSLTALMPPSALAGPNVALAPEQHTQ
ncbi:MAG: GAF domain-containing protein, partial [Betaproteobacteria bacterium]|nr:GAF domain-containing protein [Betaproteobacteria bacterium]